MLVQYATARIGAILVNINPAYRTHEVGYVLRQAGIRTLVSAPSFKASDYRAMIEEVRPDLPALRDVVYIGEPTWEELLAGGCRGRTPRACGARAATLDVDDPINIQYTSGTTGFPKGATLSHHNILNNGYFVGEICATPRRTGSACRCPSTTASAWSWATSPPPSHGACVVIPAPGFDPAATLRAVQDERCTSLYGVPDDVHRRARAARRSPSTTSRRCARASWPARRARSR